MGQEACNSCLDDPTIKPSVEVFNISILCSLPEISDGLRTQNSAEASAAHDDLIGCVEHVHGCHGVDHHHDDPGPRLLGGTLEAMPQLANFFNVGREQIQDEFILNFQV